MKKFLIGFVFSIIALSSYGQSFINPYWIYRDYFVSTSGSGDGSSPLNAASVATFEAALSALPERTHVYFKRGDTFELDNLTVPQGNMQFAAYGTGADPIITGSEDLSGATWTSESGGYYSTPMATEPKWIFIDGEAARQGESAWIQITATPSSTSRTALAATLNAYNSVESLVGAKLRLKEYAFRLSFEHNITAYNSGTGVLTTTETFVGGGVGMPFKLYGQKQFATDQNDWWWDDTNNKLWVKKSTSPSGTDIRVSYSVRAFSVTSKSYVSFIGLEFKHYHEEAIYSSLSHHLTIDDCNIHDIRTNGFLGEGASEFVTIQNSTIQRCGLNGISMGAWEDFTIYNNTIADIGQQDNLGWPIDTGLLKTGGDAIEMHWESGAIPINGHIHRNTFTTLGYQGIHLIGYNHVVEENVFDTYCNKFTDGGAIHTFHRSDLGPYTKQITIRRNIILNGVGNLEGVTTGEANQNGGIYIDNGSREITIDQNTVIGAESGTATSLYGIFINAGSTDHTITDNVIFNHSIACVKFTQYNGFPDPDHVATTINMIFTNNALIASRADNWCVITEDQNGSSSYNPFSGTGDSDNNSYVAPYRTSGATTINAYATAFGGALTGQTLAQWRTKISDDAASNAIVNTLISSNALIRDVAETIVNYNETTSVENISIGSNYVDRLNATISSAAIDPFESIAYFSSVTRGYMIDNFNGTLGTTLSGRAPDTGPTPVIVSGTHTIGSTNEMITTSNGLVSYNLGTGINDYVWEALTEISNTSSTMRMDVRLGDDAGSANNRIILDFTGGNIRLREFYASATATQTLTTAFTLATATLYTVRVYCFGATIKVYVNNVLYHTMTTSLTTGTRVGVFGDTFRQTYTLMAYPDEFLIP
jgi:hypothetical protein